MHHPVQSGIVISASDDWSVMFWRFKKRLRADILRHEKVSQELRQQSQQAVADEVDLVPLLRINTGLEVKAIAMSTDGQMLACTCYDEEEEDCAPELHLYFDENDKWTFKQSKNNEVDTRNVTRRSISLPFEPIPHCLCISPDNKYVFLAMYGSAGILKDLNEELEEDYGGRENMDEKAKNKYPDHPIPVCCLNLQTQTINECKKMLKYLKDDEYVLCISISPDGEQIAMGLSLGQVIVMGVLSLANDEDADDIYFNRWKYVLSNSKNDDDDNADSCTSIGWSPDFNWIVCGYSSGEIKLWQWRKQNGTRTIEGKHVESVNSLSISGSLMATGSDDGNLIIHDMMNIFVKVLLLFEPFHPFL